MAFSEAKRVKVDRDMLCPYTRTPPSSSPKSTAHEVDTRLSVEILVGKLIAKAARFRRKKGWHKDESGLRDAHRLNDMEKNRLLVEIMLPDQFTAGLDSSRKASGGGLCVL